MVFCIVFIFGILSIHGLCPHVEPLPICKQTVCLAAIGGAGRNRLLYCGATCGDWATPHANARQCCLHGDTLLLFFENTIPRRLPAPDHQMDSGRSYAVGGPREEMADSNT